MQDQSVQLHLTQQNFKKILYARTLRRRMTEAEKVLWDAIRSRKCGCKFRRQVPLGPFVADFCCMKHRVIVEIDGNIHDELEERDALREEHLIASGFKIIRFRNQDVVQNLSIVLEQMRKSC